jgi:hypothetical protein
MRVLMSESIASEAVMPVVNAHLAADLIVEGEQMPVFIWTIDHSASRVLVDTVKGVKTEFTQAAGL